MRMTILARLAARGALLAGLVLAQTAVAGQACQDTTPDAARTQQSLRFATQVRETLEVSGANVALIGRIGSNQSARGVRYTHVGYIFREHPAGGWTVVHALNGCGTGSSDLFDEGLANFFMDDPFYLETRVVVPAPAVQEKLARTLLGPTKRALHEASYSSIANPWTTQHQNSNGWALEIYAAALAPAGEVVNRDAAQRWLRDNGYRPNRIHIGAGERAGARLFTPHIRFGDHPDTAWQTQVYEVNTGDSAIDFIFRHDAEARLFTQRLDGRPTVTKRPTVEPKLATAAAVPVAATPPVSSIAAPSAPAGAVTMPAPRPDSQSRSQILQSMLGLIVPYACRSQGYLSQCRQIDRGNCERQIGDAVLRCFATVSDQQLFAGTEQAALKQMQEIGYCAVESIDSIYAGKPAKTAQGTPCPTIRNYK